MQDRHAVEEHPLVVPARDHYPLGVTHFRGTGSDRSSGVVLFNSATAVPQSFYGECARFFARQGYDAYTYDYRGIAKSAPDSLAGFDASVQTWAEQDISALIRFVRERHPDLDFTYFAHSIGGQILGLADNASQIDRAVFVSSQSGYWKLQGGNQKYAVWGFTHLVFPVLTRVIGYFPWNRFASGEDLPKGVALQWAGWCRSPNYLFDDPTLDGLDGYERLECPILAYCIADDDWGTRQSVQAMVSRYTASHVEYRDVHPSQFGFKNLGHFGYFKRGRESLWQDAIDWIQGSQSTRAQPSQSEIETP
jgi:predicted alpha/beta hydrolase